ncbi:deoxyribonuclease IV [Euzebya tangerina]|uniref:deoxyribonuclease IV n=1 Tax=Euzebya tangerina TaxID=591198 RepID=UPI000E323A5A|nr:deoxyribonuclease IV [Euzebya tangerina]
MLIGAHVDQADPLGTASEIGADCVQIFLGNPQGWKRPPPREDAEQLAAAEVPIYVHAPYLVNVASAESRIRIPSRKILQQHCDAAAAIGAEAVIVHGGTVTGDEDVAEGFDRWRKALVQLDSEVPVLIENTAGGDNSVARLIESIRQLWDVIGDIEVAGRTPGFCVDTCHSWSAGLDVVASVEELIDITGGIDLLHCNDSRDEQGSSRDRHETLTKGQIPDEQILQAVRVAGAPVICETPTESVADDITWLRENL